MSRRPGRTTLALAVPFVLFVAFGMARVVAPVSALGLVFHEPAEFAVAAAVTSLAGAILLLIRPVELAVARVMTGPSRAPTESERGRLGLTLEQVAARAGIDSSRLIVRVVDDSGVNAAAGAGHLLFVTSGALRLPEDEMEAILAHELGHHRGLHPVLTAVVWWLRLPGAALAAVYRLLRRGVTALGTKLGRLGQVLAIPLLVLLILWQVTVMWLFFVAELLAMRAARVSEYEADGAAADWGYARPLASAYEALAARETEPDGMVERLTAEHPPIRSRIERLRAAALPVPVR